ncbi:transcriptional regulator family: C2H2 zinc finger [Penicillium lagena]|uniref:transcriptional regulator family: C2H2 zinc finger n=1 Tax=Penicillium lagena TaxID=94218 RepID=UPI00253F7FCF|nr:transcriptional regulator family: C2H2 zinc finger [Penicillium lagena]KAJ5601845.1 transcriptional regulator family: C2H2 zinc finger [Penicillium lagena]
MASFLSVNNATSEDHPMDGASTPRANPNGAPASPTGSGSEQHPDANSQTSDRGAEGPAASSHTRNSSTATDEPMHDDSEDGTDQEGEPEGTAPPSKKKKGQRFFCTDFPPCNLSFTRSEHLARHIRKHTGERPFQCHCSRRFSRLDNLRQHAQTVHVNEEIPGDSLAATGTRFQRQVRTDRVRPPARVRAGTVGSQGGHSRGHSRNLSTSSIASTASAYSQPQELRRRPPPLIMANDPTSRARLALDTVGEPPTTPPGQVRGGVAVGSPYTPSHVFPPGAGSPHQFQSPMSATRRGFWDGKTAARRLSVPTGSNPFMTQHGTAYPPSYTTSPASTAFPTSAGVFPSPTSTNYSVSRDESSISAAEAEMRRRTWHPSSYSGFPRPSTSGLNNYPAPDTIPAPLSGNASAEQTTRLPGIESFDKVVSQHRPLTPPTRKASPMQLDSHHRPAPPPGHGFGSGYSYNQPAVRPPPPMSGPGHRRGHVSWDMSLHTGITGLDIRDRNSSRDWSQQTIAEIQNVSSRPTSSYQPSLGPTAEKSPEEHHSHNHSHSFSSANRPTRTSPEDSSSSEGVHTPSTASIDYHPAIVHSSGYVEPHESSLPSDHGAPPICGRRSSNADGYSAPPSREPRSEMFPDPSARNSGMGRLEALVAVATSENKGAAKLFL